VRIRVLRWFARRGLIELDDVRDMLARENSGFSLDASVRVGAHDRAGLERLLRYCARPPFALERLELLEDERVVYRLPKPHRDGTTALTLTPLELIAIRAGLNFVPIPSTHRSAVNHSPSRARTRLRRSSLIDPIDPINRAPSNTASRERRRTLGAFKPEPTKSGSLVMMISSKPVSA